jgi:outer membrane biosynthesis protein TonB
MAPSDHFDYSEEKRGFWARYGFLVGIVAIAGVVGFLVKQMISGESRPAPRRPPEIVMVRPTNLPPPPPPPPPPPMEQKPQMMEQTPLNEADIHPDDTPPTPAAPSLGTNIAGNGPPDGFGLSGNSGRSPGSLGGSGRSAASRFGWYANQVVRSVGDALRQNPRTRNASFDIKVRIWADVVGRVTRVKLMETTGDVAVDAAISNQVLNGFQLPDAPPAGMPMPIVMRLTARRPD